MKKIMKEHGYFMSQIEEDMHIGLRKKNEENNLK